MKISRSVALERPTPKQASLPVVRGYVPTAAELIALIVVVFVSLVAKKLASEPLMAVAGLGYVGFLVNALRRRHREAKPTQRRRRGSSWRLGWRAAWTLTEVKRPALPPPHEHVHVGVARPEDPDVLGPLSGEPCLVAAVCVRKPKGGLYFREVRAARFWLTSDLGDPLLVCGEVWLEADTADHVAHDDDIGAWFEAAAVPRGLRPEAVGEEVRLGPGMRVEARAEARRELVPGLSGYRDNSAMVLRGEPGRPVRLRRLSR